MTKRPSADNVSRRKFLVGAGTAGVAGLAGCTSEGGSGGGNGNGSNGGSGNQQLSGSVKLSGSSTVYPLANAVAGKFSKQHKQVSVSVQKTGTGGGFQQFFCKGKTDFNNASRKITKAEKQLCSKNGVNPLRLKVATDALTVVVSDKNDFVDCLTIDQLKQIWSADGATTWSDVKPSWPDKKIQRYGPAETSGTFDFFKEHVLGEHAEHTQNYQATERDNSIVRGVSGSKYAIGYLGYAYYTENKGKLKPVAINAGNGCTKPSLKTAKAGEYPLSRSLYTYVSKKALRNKPQVAAFARYFVKQGTNESLVADKIGYVPITQQTKQEQLQKIQRVLGGSGGSSGAGNSTGSN